MSHTPEAIALVRKLRDLCVGATVVKVSSPKGSRYSWLGKRYTERTEDFFTMTVEKDGQHRTFTVGGTDLGWWVNETGRNRSSGRQSE